MVTAGSVLFFFLVVLLFNAVSIACLILGYKLGSASVPVCMPPEELDQPAGYIKTSKYKPFIPGKTDQDD